MKEGMFAMPAVTANTLELPKVLPINMGGVTQPRRVLSITEAPSGFEGEGFPVRRAFAGVPPHLLDPFIHMDQMGEVNYAPGEPKGTPWHPHRGFETFTYLMDGEFLHQDSTGGGGSIKDGETQYMTAGDGILHIETPPEHLVLSGGIFHGVQLWINLPAEKKRITPQYQDLKPEETIFLTDAHSETLIRVLAGQYTPQYAGPGISHTPLTITHITVPAGVTTEIPWPVKFNALAYILSGTGSVGPDHHPISEGQLAGRGNGDSIILSASPHQNEHTPALEVFLIGGEPLREPIVSYGPFVMNTKSEVLEALEDFQKGRFGQIPPHALQPYRV